MPIQITTQRGNQTGSIPNLARPVRMAVVGESLGEIVLVTDEKANLSLSDGTVDTLSVATVESIEKISAGPNDETDVYTATTDYALTSPNKITWNNTAMTAPTLEGTIRTTGGSIDATKVAYVITVLDQSGNESTPSAVMSLEATTGATNTHFLEWNRISFSTGYKIYSSNSLDTTAASWKLVTTVASGNTVSYEVTSYSAGTKTLPQVNSAVKRPKTGEDYYVTYTYRSYDYNVNIFTTVYDVQQKYGIGSDLANIARILINEIGVPEVYMVATETSSNASYMAAIDKLVNFNLQYIVALKESTVVQDYLVQHAATYSTVTQQKYRFANIGYDNTVNAVGSTLLNRIQSFGTPGVGEKRCIFVVSSGNKMYMNVWQTPTATTYGGVTYEAGDYIDNYLVNNQFVAAAVQGLYVVADDEATSIIGTSLPGFNFGLDSGNWNDSVEKNKLEAVGATYILNNNGKPVVYNDNTNDVSMTENAERSVISAEDKMRRQLETDNQRFLGKKITKGLLEAIKTNVTSTLDRLAGDFLINSWNTLSVSQDATVKTKVNVLFQYQPVYPLKELAFIYTFDLGTVSI